VCALAALAPGAAASPYTFVVHEWGTFTSVAGEDGVALDWLPLEGKSDLPSFVYSVERGGGGLRGERTQIGKGETRGTVRMETPVVYFYADAPQKVSLSVGFPKGSITEWYPQAQAVEGGRIDWGTFLVEPVDDEPLPREAAPSHYYPARETDASIVRVCGTETTEREKFLFYRGVGTFDLPLKVALAPDGHAVQVSGGAVGKVVVFERQGARVGWTITPLDRERGARVTRPSLDRKIDDLGGELTQLLTGEGLYAREASAMVATWRDQWFEEGLRAFYVLPRGATDTALPMKISPSPTSLVRVLVGRVELITPETERAVAALVPGDRTEVLRTLRARYGRFAEPILRRVRAHATTEAVRARIDALLSQR
jgi:hypothetical protein